ncbi:hypothetical protein CRU99_12195 [Malaciobacter mytili]|uniref:Glycosyl hydrolase n=1 Tax=Malaciobacter mytili LMG 24559 TaxID=1032238 RepID=A0AAX2AFF6_9BACT|nr:hypothetical protein [Malaciobacter mytili]AXH15523.1 hypothetical protein AMYT_1955 [Malaciobacter mytili LMG 24559]RXI37246.1 hypothetical protein CRU99_12195 [Malaciobacter mytili]RXK12021.1 hypothetical protein CP985_14775 [Malaciobacter mytili LMG 24559]
MNKEPFIWDNYSDQPHVIKDKAYKKAMRKKHIFDYIKLFFTSLFILPFAILVMKFFKGKKEILNKDFYAIGVNLDKGNTQQELIEELGVKNLLIRVPLWDIKNIDLYVNFAKSFTINSSKNILINIMQDREHIENPTLLKNSLNTIFKKFDTLVDEYQIATTINRAKWGFFSVKEYLDFYKVAQTLRDEKFPKLKLLGPSVIDFEYYYNARAMFNLENIKYDKVSSLLYVDRRGSPYNTQYAFFDTKNKIDLLYSLVKLSPKCSDEVYITEVNWPILDTAPYAPTSQKECVSNELYTKYMMQYHKIAKESKKINRVYWHQLIAPGYGLVDNRDGKIVKLPQFYAYKEMINSEN